MDDITGTGTTALATAVGEGWLEDATFCVIGAIPLPFTGKSAAMGACGTSCGGFVGPKAGLFPSIGGSAGIKLPCGVEWVAVGAAGEGSMFGRGAT